ncbi:hypothetical protein IJD44_07380 [bacterium]|nr:hypothetical protein [bacterium]
MTVGDVSGVDYNRYQQYEKQAMQSNPYYYNIRTNATQPDMYVSNSSETCTDRKDDGKIGFFSAVGNAIKGVGKTIVNGVKGMFTNKEGKFSLGKTLLSIGTAALCIAVPAVGVAACVVGGTMGAIQVGKGIYNAATAETDAEAKKAWQNVGGGAFTVAASVVGAKAGVKAVKSTAGNASALQSVDDTIAAGQKVSVRDYGTALVKDIWASTRNQVGKIKTNISAIKLDNMIRKHEKLTGEKAAKYGEQVSKAMDKADENVWAQTNKITQARHDIMGTAKDIYQINKMRRANAKAIVKQEAGKKLTKADLKAISDWEPQAFKAKGFSEKAVSIAQKQNQIEFGISEAIRHPIKTGQKAWSTARGYVTKENAHHLWNGIQDAYKKNIKGQTLSQMGNKLTGKAQNIWSDLSKGKYSYPEVVSKYGFDNVAQVIQYMGGTVYASEAI